MLLFFYHIGTLLVTRLEVTLQVHETNVVILTPKFAALLEFEQRSMLKLSIDCEAYGCEAAKQATTPLSRAINRPRKHAIRLLISHGTRVRKRALASQAA